jgi:hypothetical protein
MTFQDEQKQKEFEAFAEWYAEIAKRPSTSAHKSTMNQLRDMGSRLYGSAAFQEVLRANRVANITVSAERKLGKQSGGRSDRHSQSPTGRPPKPGSDRAKRLAEMAQQSDRLGAGKVVAADNAKGVTEKVRVRAKDNATVVTADELANAQLSPILDSFDAVSGGILADAADLDWKELLRKYDQEAIHEVLLTMGETEDTLQGKTPRQLANTLKKHVNG